MKKKILIFPCGSEIALELHRALSYSVHFELFGTSSISDHGKFVYENYIPDLPFIDDPSFIEKLNQIIDTYSIDFIFPAHDSVVLKCAMNRKKLHCEVITSSAEVCEIARSKKKTYEVLKNVIPVPKTFQLDDIQTYPVFLKPDVGQGSKGCLVTKSKEDVELAFQKDPSLLILEYLPGKEYTIDCFSDNEGNLIYSQGRQRERILNGISVHSMPVDRPEFEDYAKKILSKIPFNGVWFFQLKENTRGQLVLMEIAPRVAGTMALSRLKGVNLPLLACFNACHLPVSVCPNNYFLEIDRALENKFKLNLSYKTVYTDLDDCLIIDGKVNVSLVGFLYQCINEKKKIILLSKHAKPIEQTLHQYRLDNLFDQVIHLCKSDDKYKYIQEVESIFIDDSFAERQKVHEQLNIPVFSPDMIAELV